MDLYADQILDHYKHPRNAAPLAAPTNTHEEANVSCGDRIRLELAIKDGVIREVGWTGGGCAISQAGMSLLSERLRGMSVEEASKLRKQDILDLLHVPVSERRTKCALLCLHTVLNTLRLHTAQPVQSWAETVADPHSA